MSFREKSLAENYNRIKNPSGFLNESSDVFKNGDKVKTRDGNVETVFNINSNGNIETIENDYSWPPESLTLVTDEVDGAVTEIEINKNKPPAEFGHLGPVGDGKLGYICIYGDKYLEVYADSQYQAQLTGAEFFKVPKNKSYKVSTWLAQDENGKQVTHVPDF